jgi:hypothetical protein
MPGAASHRGAPRAGQRPAGDDPPASFRVPCPAAGGSATLARADPPVSPGRRVPSLIWRVAAASAGAPLVVGVRGPGDRAEGRAGRRVANVTPAPPGHCAAVGDRTRRG